MQSTNYGATFGCGGYEKGRKQVELLPFIALFDFNVIKAAWPLATGNAHIERREKILNAEVDFHAVQIDRKVIFLSFDRKGVHLVFGYGELHAETLMP